MPNAASTVKSSVAHRPIIHSLLETDLYKFTMQQPMLHSMPTNQAEYRFVCRNHPAFPLAELAADVNAQLDALCALRFTEDELRYLGSLRFIASDTIDFLRLFQFQRRFITVSTEGDTLHIVAKGPQVHVMGFEIYVLAIVNELYFARLTAMRGGPERFLAAARERACKPRLPRPGRPGHGADRCGGHGRLFGRLRPVLCRPGANRLWHRHQPEQ